MLLRSMRSRALRIFAAFLALAVVWTWPLARHLSSRIPHDPGDPILNTDFLFPGVMTLVLVISTAASRSTPPLMP